MVKTTTREAKLLDEARENYRVLKERFLEVQSENNRLRESCDEVCQAAAETREQLVTNFLEAKEALSAAAGQVADEQHRREALFEEFKLQTLGDVREIYEGHIERLIAELAGLDESSARLLEQNRLLTVRLADADKQAAAREHQAAADLRALRDELETEIANLSRRLRDSSRSDDRIQELLVDLSTERAEVSRLKDELHRADEAKTALVAEHESAVRDVQDQLYEANAKALDGDFVVRRLRMERDALQKNVDMVLQREDQARSDLLALQRDTFAQETKLKAELVSKQIAMDDATIRLQESAKRLQKTVSEQHSSLADLQQQLSARTRDLQEARAFAEAARKEVKLLQEKMAHMQAAFDQERHVSDTRLKEAVVQMNRPPPDAERSTVDRYLAKIEELQNEVERRDEEIIATKNHYRELLKRMKRSIEQREQRLRNS